MASGRQGASVPAKAGQGRPSPNTDPTEIAAMQLVHFTDDFYDSGEVKYAANSYHPLNSETQSLVATGFASLVDSDDASIGADVLAALAKIACDRADAAEAQAADLRKEADKATRTAKAAAKRVAEEAAAQAAAEAAAAAEVTRKAAEEAAAAEAQAKAAAAEAERLAAESAAASQSGNSNP